MTLTMGSDFKFRKDRFSLSVRLDWNAFPLTICGLGPGILSCYKLTRLITSPPSFFTKRVGSRHLKFFAPCKPMLIRLNSRNDWCVHRINQTISNSLWIPVTAVHVKPRKDKFVSSIPVTLSFITMLSKHIMIYSLEWRHSITRP